MKKEELNKKIAQLSLFLSNYGTYTASFVAEFERASEMFEDSSQKFKRRYNKHIERLFFRLYKDYFKPQLQQPKSKKPKKHKKRHKKPTVLCRESPLTVGVGSRRLSLPTAHEQTPQGGCEGVGG